MLAAAAAGAVWYLNQKRAPKASAGPYVEDVPPQPKPVCSGSFRYGWKIDDDWNSICWDFCTAKRVDDAVCELA